MTSTQCAEYCEVCEREDSPPTRTVSIVDESGYCSEQFGICESCFEYRPEDVIEVEQS